jgi:hypothetical protein
MNFKGKTFAAVISILFAASANIEAFIPDYPRAIVPGDHHKKITLESLGEIYTEYGYGFPLKPYTITMKIAKEIISQSNADVDHNDITVNQAVWHCDGEQLSECSNLVKSETQRGVDAILSGNIDGARKIIGAVTHTLQDFYAHSNWVEMRGAVVNDEMGYGPISNVAAPDEDTCMYFNLPSYTVLAPAIACAMMTTNNLLNTGKLTSGYYLGTTGAPAAGVKKCFHGGSWDGLGVEGINKDASVCSFLFFVISPHNDFHKPAVDAAHAATVKYFRHLKSLLVEKKGPSEGEALFKQFLGFSFEIGFAIDTTSQETTGIIAWVQSIIQNLTNNNKAPSKYVLSVIKDQAAPAPLVSKDSPSFLAKLSSIDTGSCADRGDCPARSGLGAYKAVAALGEGSNMFVYADEGEREPATANLAALVANFKKIKINNNLIGSRPSYNAKYFEMSEITGGQVFVVDKSESEKLTQISDTMLSSYYAPIVTLSGALTAGKKSYEFKVDSTTDKLSVFISITSGSVSASISRPDNSVVGANDVGVKHTALSSLIIYEITNPRVGDWKLNLSGSGEFSVNIAGNTPLSFDNLKFVAYDNRSIHSGFFVIEGFPIAGSTSAIEATLSDVTSDVSFELRSKSGKVLGALKLDVVDEYPGVKTVFLKEDFVVPNEDFVVYAFGKDANGKAFQRVMPQKIVPQAVSIKTLLAGNISLNANTTYTFRVANNGNKDTFNINAVDDKGYVVSISPQTVSLKAGEYVDIDVVLNPGSDTSAVGVASTLTFTVTPTLGSKIGNYAVVQATVTK